LVLGVNDFIDTKLAEGTTGNQSLILGVFVVNFEGIDTIIEV
jgi:hypothetical protein